MNRKQTYIQIALLIGILLMANLLSQGFFRRVDLTSEGRYSLTDLGKQTADTLDAILNVRVYLAGEDLPPETEQYRKSVQAFLEDFKAYAGSNLQYQFIDPNGKPELIRELMKKGVERVPIDVRKDGSISRNWVYPAMALNYRKEEDIVNLLQFDCQSNPTTGQFACDYLKAEAELEYKFVSTLRRMIFGKKRIISILASNTGYTPRLMQEFLREIGKRYKVITSRVDSGQAIPTSKAFLPKAQQKDIIGEGVDVLIVPQPARPFTEREKYEIDQHIMRGGRVLWVMDGSGVNHSDFQNPETELVVTEPLDHNLSDQFLKYGFKLNKDLVQDLRAYETVVVATHQGRPRTEFRKWSYFPVATEFADNIATDNIDAVTFRYVSSIDTLNMSEVKFTPLIRSSAFSRSLSSPVQINFSTTINRPPPQEVFKDKGNRTLVLLAEGQFRSLYQGRDTPTDETAPNPPSAKFLANTSFPTKQMLIADGEFLLPDHLPGRDNMPFDNLAFLMNSIDYLINDTTYAEMRSKNVMVRKLNPAVIKNQKTEIQVVNLGGPIAIVILFGLARYLWRKRQYAKPIA